MWLFIETIPADGGEMHEGISKKKKKKAKKISKKLKKYVKINQFHSVKSWKPKNKIILNTNLMNELIYVYICLDLYVKDRS